MAESTSTEETKKINLELFEKDNDANQNLNTYLLRNPRFTLDNDVILSAVTKIYIDESLARLRFHHKIYQEWGFSRVDPMGMTAILNFYGPPGTGKTLCAEAFAGKLGLPFISLGIAELESKFMGETAKNIQAAFTQATATGAVLFFDEADTLLGKRLSSVTQGVDNEVNAMRSTLLIELERFEGIVIFATNFARNYDEAFRSRIGYHVEFTLPDQDALYRLWDRFLLPEIPILGNRDDILKTLCEISVGLSGREIRTCMRLALPKALINAEQQGISPQLSIQHLQDAITQVFSTHKSIGNRNLSTADDAQTAKNLLGIK
ncbi:ATP-binding protein [Providencia zhijiangensis]|uniref:ATP-binding protein n=1 Tax=Providencia zhijiangensis TaxID=3053982 RepID=A0ABZ0MY49_9GAMM|nr:ATP-binding protein [Providencia sp. D4759]WPA90978.1 ATP-binding protein [Providencia sp. D4759]